jgi:hypothetical protein
VKVGVWYEAGYKSGNVKITVRRISYEVIKKRYYDKDGHFICYKVKVYGEGNKPYNIVEENWNFRELSSLEKELL